MRTLKYADRLPMNSATKRPIAGSVQRHCLENCDEEGEAGDFVAMTSSHEPPATDVNPHSHLPEVDSVPRPSASAKCETELESICADMESILFHLWGENVKGVSEGLDRNQGTWPTQPDRSRFKTTPRGTYARTDDILRFSTEKGISVLNRWCSIE